MKTKPEKSTEDDKHAKPVTAAAKDVQPPAGAKPSREKAPAVAKSAKADPAATHLATTWKYARPLTACRFDPTGRYLFTGAEDYLVQRWSVADGKSTPLAGHESWVRAIGFSPDGATTFTAGFDGRLIWWSTTADKPTPQRSVEAHRGWVRALAVSPDGKLVATCGNDRLVKLWNTADGKLVHELAGHESHVYNVAFHPSGERLVSCDLKAVLKHWELASGKLVRDVNIAALHKYDTSFRADIGGARSISFSRDGNLLAVGGITNVTNAFAGIGNPAVVELDWESGKPKVQHGGKEPVNAVAWGIVQHADGYWIGLASGRQGGWLYFWKPGEQNEFFKFKLPDGGRDLALASDGMRIAAAHADGNVRLYELLKA
jgi:WD40 repeat protein